MKILFINPPSKSKPVARDMAGGLGFDSGGVIALPPLDLAYMAATLLEKGHTARIIDSDIECYSVDDIYGIVGEYKPDIVISTVSLPSFESDCAFLSQLNNRFPATYMIKTAITYQPLLKEMLKQSRAKICIFGECDLSIEDTIMGKDKRGTAYLENGELKVEENIFITDMDKLPLPARGLLRNDRYRYPLLKGPVTTMQTTRGCPYPCGYYCAYPLVQGKAWRPRSPEHVIREIENIVKNYSINNILFRDATFTLDKERAKKICELIIVSGLKVDWWCETRIDCLDGDLMKVMKRAGCQGMNVGVETGDAKVMEAQAKIGLTLDKLKSIRHIAKTLGIKLHFLLMIGLPDETRSSLYETYRLLKTLKPESLGICIVTPYPGTPLYREAEGKGWLETKDWSKFGGHYPVMHTGNLASGDLGNAYRMIWEGMALARGGIIGRIKLALFEKRFKEWVSAK
jgi:radical SAM superfamily enzyme YgiQ (UPF0313 family)